MHRNRIQQEVAIQLPRPPAPAVDASAFMLFPLSCLPGLPVEQQLWRLQLYMWAFEQAKEVARPSLPERDLLAVWN